MNEDQIRNGLRKHWLWLKRQDASEVAEFVLAHGKRTMASDYPIHIKNAYGRRATIMRDGAIVLVDTNRGTEIEFGDISILEEALAISKSEATNEN